MENLSVDTLKNFKEELAESGKVYRTLESGERVLTGFTEVNFELVEFRVDNKRSFFNSLFAMSNPEIVGRLEQFLDFKNEPTTVDVKDENGNVVGQEEVLMPVEQEKLKPSMILGFNFIEDASLQIGEFCILRDGMKIAQYAYL